MKLSVELDVTMSAKAVLREGKVSVELFCCVGYGAKGKSVTISKTVDAEEELKAISDTLTKVLEAESKGLLMRARAAADESLRIALLKGEE